MRARQRRGKAGLTVGITIVAAVVAAGIWLVVRVISPGADRELAADTVGRYCVDCHNSLELAGNLTLAGDLASDIGAHAEIWEKVVHKIQAGSMPPLGEPRPGPATYERLTRFLETELDQAAAAAPNPGTLPALRRLTRTEYRNAIRDLLAIEDLPAEMDFELLLPADNASSGFDNIAELLFVSPVTLERYLGAAQKIARLAVGDPAMPTMVNIHRTPLELPQDETVSELPLGSRGGLVTQSYFPLDAEYDFDIGLAGFAREPHDIEITIDGTRVALASTGGRAREFQFRVPVAAGPRVVGISFVRRTHALDESTVRVQRRSRGTLPAIETATISGPFAATGPGVTPSRTRIFSCTPRDAAEESICARQILGDLARQAYRRPVGADDIDVLMEFYAAGRAERDFESGIQRALERLLVSPHFLYRIERPPSGTSPGSVYAVSPLELASRLSFFLWSSLPDERLLGLAESGDLARRTVLEQEVERMLADPRAASLVDNFASQWLFLRDVEGKDPDLFIFRDYDESLRAAFIEETERFVASIINENRSVLELIEADYTFVNERLAEHYGIPFVRGSRFRRVTFPPDSPRGGLLGQGSILALTSYPTRTSPVLRGKYVLDNLLAMPPPPPPPDVPALEAEAPGERATTTLREAMAAHRASPECASCHARMDPIGFAFENFDAVGRWRESEGGLPIEADSILPDGTAIEGIEGVKSLLLDEPERFVSAVTEKLLMYAIGRNIQYYDRPAVRAIVREAAAEGYRFDAIVWGIVNSVPFRMRSAPPADLGPGETGA